MVTLEDLEAFDLQVWLGSCTLAAKALHCHPSSISRRCRTVTETFQLLTLKRSQYEGRNHEWHNLLLMQRRLHQHHRFLCRQKLRLEASPNTIESLAPGWWTPGPRQQKCRPYHQEEIKRLISESVIDAAIMNGRLIAREELSRYGAIQELKAELNKQRAKALEAR